MVEVGYRSKSVPVGTRGAIVLAEGPRAHEYAALDQADSMAAVRQNIPMTLRGATGAAIRAALHARRPILDITCARRR